MVFPGRLHDVPNRHANSRRFGIQVALQRKVKILLTFVARKHRVRSSKELRDDETSSPGMATADCDLTIGRRWLPLHHWSAAHRGAGHGLRPDRNRQAADGLPTRPRSSRSIGRSLPRLPTNRLPARRRPPRFPCCSRCRRPLSLERLAVERNSLNQVLYRDRRHQVLLTRGDEALLSGDAASAVAHFQALVDAGHDAFVWPDDAAHPCGAQAFVHQRWQTLPVEARRTYERLHGHEARALLTRSGRNRRRPSACSNCCVAFRRPMPVVRQSSANCSKRTTSAARHGPSHWPSGLPPIAITGSSFRRRCSRSSTARWSRPGVPAKQRMTTRTTSVPRPCGPDGRTRLPTVCAATGSHDRAAS